MNLPTAKLHLETSMLMGVEFLPVAKKIDIDPKTNKSTMLEQLKEKHDETCPHCTNATGFTHTVFGAGNSDARLMFIGEAPGAEEDRQGIPFVGDAGKKLDEIITAMGMQRENVYIANVLKSRPPDNRTPSPDEIAKCAPFLALQVEIIQPEVIVALGAPAAKFLLETSTGITKLRGIWHEYKAIPVMPTFHPAFLLRNYTKLTRGQVWSDMKQVMEKLG
ncbi:MAG: uracil-DNA glycosylase [Phycisphaerales bacterium]|nr:uracil-DNA glycosylase [PVC group bacterium]MBL6998198.1 uracil-DNA glycosylase [Phycisphaerales bacterium]